MSPRLLRLLTVSQDPRRDHDRLDQADFDDVETLAYSGYFSRPVARAYWRDFARLLTSTTR